MRIVCIGDSLTYGYRIRRSEAWTHLLEKKYNIEVINKGICGDSTGGMLARFQQDVVLEKPSHVLIMGGTNDFIMGLSWEMVRANIFTMGHHAHAYGIIPIIGIPTPTEPEMAQKYWSSITDFQRVNQEIERYKDGIIDFAKKINFEVIDFYTNVIKELSIENKEELYMDGLHWTAKGNAMLTQIIHLKGL
ncbi:MAG: GDSL-type esterase/lipase family protein [Thermotaleaceae bacterium]